MIPIADPSDAMLDAFCHVVELGVETKGTTTLILLISDTPELTGRGFDTWDETSPVWQFWVTPGTGCCMGTTDRTPARVVFDPVPLACCLPQPAGPGPWAGDIAMATSTWVPEYAVPAGWPPAAVTLSVRFKAEPSPVVSVLSVPVTLWERETVEQPAWSAPQESRQVCLQYTGSAMNLLQLMETATPEGDWSAGLISLFLVTLSGDSGQTWDLSEFVWFTEDRALWLWYTGPHENWLQPDLTYWSRKNLMQKSGSWYTGSRRNRLLVCDTVTNLAMDQGDYWTWGLQVAVESWAQVKIEAVSRVHYKVWNNTYYQW